MVFQPVGFTKPPMSPPALVSSYLTFSPLPRSALRGGFPFCGTFRDAAVPSDAPSR